MQPLDELKIEYKRLSRHTNYLSKRFSAAVARDLAACLRNWVQLSSTIDTLTNEYEWDLRFSKQNSTKSAKSISRKGSSISIPLPATASTKDLQISGLRVFDRALPPEEVKKLYQSELSSRRSIQSMQLEVWLNHAAYQVKHDKASKDISRKIFIDRAANLLGGTHPISNYIEDEHATWADPYIVELLSTFTGHWPVPYAILMESAQEILRVFDPYLKN